MKDTQGRNINYLRISVTDRCNLRCMYCMPEEGICKKGHGDMMSLEEIYEAAYVCAKLGISKIRVTGGEPLIRKGLSGLLQRLSKLEGIQDLAMTTNGILLPKYAEELKAAGLHRVNISLDTMKPERYKYITRGGDLGDVLAGIDAAEKAGLAPIKLNTVLIGGFNDDELKDFVKLTLDRAIDVRFIELMPIGQASGWAKKHFISNSEVLQRIGELKPLDSPDKCSPAQYYSLPGAKGRVGLINPITHSFCSSCNRIRLTADGKLKSCLHSEGEVDIKELLRKGEGLQEAIEKAILQKPKQHHLNAHDNRPITRDMYRIGG